MASLVPSFSRLIKTQTDVKSAAGKSAARALWEVQQLMVMRIFMTWYEPYRSADARAVVNGKPLPAHHFDEEGLQRCIRALDDASLVGSVETFCEQVTTKKAVQDAPPSFPRLSEHSPLARVHMSSSHVKRQMLALRRVLFNANATLGVVAMCEFLLVRLIQSGFRHTHADRRVRIERRDVMTALQQDPILFAWLERPDLVLEDNNNNNDPEDAANPAKKRKARPRVEKPLRAAGANIAAATAVEDEDDEDEDEDDDGDAAADEEEEFAVDDA